MLGGAMNRRYLAASRWRVTVACSIVLVASLTCPMSAQSRTADVGSYAAASNLAKYLSSRGAVLSDQLLLNDAARDCEAVVFGANNLTTPTVSSKEQPIAAMFSRNRRGGEGVIVLTVLREGRRMGLALDAIMPGPDGDVIRWAMDGASTDFLTVSEVNISADAGSGPSAFELRDGRLTEVPGATSAQKKKKYCKDCVNACLSTAFTNIVDKLIKAMLFCMIIGGVLLIATAGAASAVIWPIMVACMKGLGLAITLETIAIASNCIAACPRC